MSELIATALATYGHPPAAGAGCSGGGRGMEAGHA
jgi:hypothetical protein